MDYYALLFFRYLKSKGSKGLRMIYNAFKGGTEQLLPVNTDTPSTSPLIADIKYTDELRENQEFTYRECPITVDGKAKLKSIKGNTLVWNQMAPYIDSSGWEQNNSTTVFSDNEAQCTALGGTWGGVRTKNTLSVKANHKYLVSAEVRALNSNESVTIATGLFSSIVNIASVSSTAYSTYSVIVDNTTDKNVYFNIGNRNNTNSFAVKNVMLFDLTQMFGSTKADEILAMETAQAGSGVAYFKSLFPLPYYQYDAGSLLSFNGTGIKTVGKNLLPPSSVTHPEITYNNGYYEYNLTAVSATERRLFGNWGIQNAVSLGLMSGTYIWHSEAIGTKNPTVFVRVSVHGTEAYVTWNANTSRYINADDKFFILLYFGSTGTYSGKIGIQLELGSTATTFEPYTTSTTSLPVSTYFPTGMKSAGTVYDEFVSSRAYTRVGEQVFNGTESWTYDSNNALYWSIVSNGIITNGATQHIRYTTNNRFADRPWGGRTDVDGTVGMYYGQTRIYLKSTQFADVNALKTWLTSNPMTVNYALATPTETNITSATMVTDISPY